MKINLKRTTSSLLVILLGWLTTASLSAATLTVTSTTDGAAGSLRNRIASATAGDVIVFDASLAGQTLTLTNEILLSDNFPAFANLTITATNLSGGVTIQGSNSKRLFYVGANDTLSMSGMKLTSGGGGGANFNNIGGAFCVVGALNLTSCSVLTNTSSSGGGAFYVAGNGTVNLSGCSVIGNTSSGGGVFYMLGGGSASVSANQSTFAYNSATSSALINNGSTATFSQCLICSNSTSGNFGLGNGGSLTFVNCTITANTGGGSTIIASTFGSTVTMVHCTVTGNSAVNFAGGIAVLSGTANVTNTILSGNSPADTYNSGGTFNDTSNLIGGSPLLGALANNGGPTLTRALQSNSPAINAGIAIAGLNTDQRGRTRQAFGASDIGAFERTAFDTGQTIVTAPDGASWYLGAPAQGSDLSIYREVSGQLPVNVGGAAVRIGQANDGTVLVGNLGGGIYSRTGSTSGVGSAWPQLTSVFAGDGAAWFLGPDSSFGSLSIYRWANSGLPAFSSGAGTNLTVLFDGSIMTRANNNGDYRRLGSSTGLGSAWQQVFIASAAPALGNSAKASNNFQFGFAGQAGKTFSVYTSTNLTLPIAQWTAIGATVETSAGNYSFTDTAATNSSQRYYRVTSP